VDGFWGGGVGDTVDDAIEMALDNTEALVEHFFANITWYLQNSEYREKLPKYLKLKLVDSRERLADSYPRDLSKEHGGPLININHGHFGAIPLRFQISDRPFFPH
jgi:hypothetical protein